MENTLQAKNKKHQVNFKRAINWLIKYNSFNDLRNIAEGDGNEKEYNRINKKCENSYDKFLDYMEELPKYEQNKIYKSELY
jgi:hypothetical protein